MITQIGEVADERGVCFILVAGDLFDDNTVGDDVVTRTCHRLANDVHVPVYILPGNHDFSGGPSCVYHRSPFKPLKPDHAIVLDQPELYVVGERGEASPEEDVVILPALVQRRNESGDPIGHIDADFGRDRAPDALRVGLAHGGVEAFGG